MSWLERQISVRASMRDGSSCCLAEQVRSPVGACRDQAPIDMLSLGWKLLSKNAVTKRKIQLRTSSELLGCSSQFSQTRAT